MNHIQAFLSIEIIFKFKKHDLVDFSFGDTKVLARIRIDLMLRGRYD